MNRLSVKIRQSKPEHGKTLLTGYYRKHVRLFIGADRYQTFRNRRIIHEKNQWNVESGEGQDAVACFVIWTCSCNHSDGACRGNKSCA
ncbi:hypothetical protein EL79_5315 [Escherichia coli]|nr:hypothetical protein EL79_5315 [Escherichia coli]